ncbi:MAG: helix-turn-helix transcriptional regulator [Lachnospiraceae bacterium]|nr:helix-turn-helix transcriptional regulator [Clostridiales bacterium]MDU7632857.1 helix-turn-helix transcriptional regulator [Lachnospiraceae bacterium]DAI14028.1 MAG TPA: helix-turn-helix domain protein [Caudoviricetes sp.]
MKILLDKIMLSKNLTIRQVSNMTGISKSSIQRIMNNEISPSADTLELLAKGLKVRISDLLESPYK